MRWGDGVLRLSGFKLVVADANSRSAPLCAPRSVSQWLKSVAVDVVAGYSYSYE